MNQSEQNTILEETSVPTCSERKARTSSTQQVVRIFARTLKQQRLIHRSDFELQLCNQCSS